jgi:hypothetical protein
MSAAELENLKAALLGAKLDASGPPAHLRARLAFHANATAACHVTAEVLDFTFNKIR